MIVVMNRTEQQLIYELAACESTNGFKKSGMTSREFGIRFKEFSRLIRRGSFTLDQLEESVFERHGLISKKEKKHE